MIITRALILTFFSVFYLTVINPPDLTAQRWKRMRYEAIYGIGASNFLGELGGANNIGRDFFYDLEFTATRPNLNAGMRYRVTQYFYMTSMLTYGWIYGNDQLTKEEFRHNRNLSFRSPVIELSVYGSMSLTKEQVGRRYKLRGIKGRKWLGVNLYPWAGFAVFYFNPRAKYTDGKWYSLQPLGTEGQGLVQTRKPYSRVQVAIPFGLGFKYGFDRRWSISVEYGIRKTFTDYLDDVSTTYFDKEYLKSQKGNIAAYFSNPSPSSGPANYTVPGQQRGDPSDKDSYMFMHVSLNYKMVFRRTRRSRPKF